MTTATPVPTATSPGRRRRWPLALGAAAIGLLAFVLVWFQPQKLFIDERVDEAIPTIPTVPATTPAPSPSSSAPSGPTTSTPTIPMEPRELARGEFVSRDHATSGVVRVLELADGRTILRLEEFDTDNGPDLYLYLSTTDAAGAEGAFDDDHLDLGRLAGNQGNQNYDLPSGTDLARYGTVVIWCDRFDSAFGAADLAAA